LSNAKFGFDGPVIRINHGANQHHVYLRSQRQPDSGFGCTATWTSYNKPASITQGSSTISFLDGPDHQRFKQVTPQGKTLHFDSFGVHAELIVATGPGKWNEYLTVGRLLSHVDVLHLRIAEDFIEAFFLADAALLPAAVGRADVSAVRIDPDVAGFDALRGFHRLGQIVGDDSRGVVALQWPGRAGLAEPVAE
jgi:hypothetical protein